MHLLQIIMLTTGLATTYSIGLNSQTVPNVHNSLEKRALSPTELLANGKTTQSLNAKFATLAADEACKDGDQACIKGSFAKCDHGKYVMIPCGATLTCYAMPLVLKSGTSIGCVTAEIAASRIAATGATGGITGDESKSNATVSSITPKSASNSTTPVDSDTKDDQHAEKEDKPEESVETEDECEDTPF